jgi:acetolactate synthase-1/2/3 large subunit
MELKVSDYVFDFLKSKGVDTIFLVSGGASGHLLNSVKQRGLKYICNYHEQACAMSAEGYAKTSNNLACVLVTNGPGSTNTITGILGAYQDSIPMFIISGQVPVAQSLCSLPNEINLRQLGVQECDIISVIKPITKYCKRVIDAKKIKYYLEKSYHLATNGRKGPVWLEIPLDIQNTIINTDDLLGYIKTISSNTISISNIDEILNIITKSKKPLIVVGNGIHLSGMKDSFIVLKNKLKIPVICTWTSKDLMDQNDDLFVGNFGIMGERSGNFAVQNADLLLILGSRLSIPNIGYQFRLFSPKSFKIMVDIDNNEIIKPTINIDYPLNGDLKDFFSIILDRIENIEIPECSDWISQVNLWKHKYPTFLPEYKTITNKINSFYLMEVLSGKLTDNDIIVTDMGTSFTCTMQSLQMNGKNRLFTSSGCSSMGFGLPGAIGAYMSNPTKRIILIAGDGGLQMNIQELQTIVHNKIPIKIFVLNNNGYLAISSMQTNLFKGNFIGSNEDSGISSPDFCKIASAYGIKNFKFKNNFDLENKIDDVLSSNGSVLCEIMMVENQLLIPRVQSSVDINGNIVSNSLDNMFPYLNDNEK